MRINQIKTPKLRNNKGFTVVELIVALLLFTTLIVLVGGIIISSMRASTDATVVVEASKLGGDILDYITEELKYADEILVSDTTHTGYETISFEGGIFKVGGTALFDAGIYRNLKMQLNFSVADGLITLTLAAYDGGHQTVFRETRIVTPLNAGSVTNPAQHEIKDTNMIYYKSV